MNQLGDFIDLSQYPVDRLDSAQGQSLLDHCHRMIRQQTICVLEDFLRPQATQYLAEEITRLENRARKIDFRATPYGWMDNSGFPDDHPRSQLMRRHCSVITTELLEENSRCRQLFEFDELTEFVRRLLQYDVLYRSACPNISIRMNIMQQDDEFGWHYDTNDGVVSFITQNAEEGGLFEYVPLIRSEEDENYIDVQRLFDGNLQPEQAVTPAGTFTLFFGRRSIHQVSRVGSSSRSRQSLLFSYDRKPDMVFPENIRKRMTEPSTEPFHGM